MIGYVDGLPFHRVARTRPKVGHGPLLYSYTVFVEEGTIPRPRVFAQAVYEILGDRRSWIKSGKVAFQQVASGGNTQVILAKPDTVDRLCAPLQTEGAVSCRMESKVVINVDRWKYAVPHWTGPLRTYRQMVVNHEWGHRIGRGHGYCPGPGEPAPVMQQQTYGLQGCEENSWPLASELL
jgi:hypothetical protein